MEQSFLERAIQSLLSVIAGYPTAYFYGDLERLGLTLGFGAPAFVLLRTWMHHRSRFYLFLCAVPLLFLATLFADGERRALRNGIIEVAIARELGVDLRQVPLSGPFGEFPSSYLLPQIAPEVTTRTQVHTILRTARGRYHCGNYEKYLLLSADYNPDDLDASQVVNVDYHANDRVWGVHREDSADGPGLQGCVAF